MALRARYCQGFKTKVWSWFWSIFSLKTLRLNFGKFFEVEVWSRLWGRCLVEILMLRYGWDFGAEFWSTCDMTWRRYFDERTQPLGPLCLWQYLLFISLSPIPFPFDQFQIIRSKYPPHPIKKRNHQELNFNFSTNISLLSSQVGHWQDQTLDFVDNKKVSHLELNKPSKHQIERPLFLKDCTIASVYLFFPSFWPSHMMEVNSNWRPGTKYFNNVALCFKLNCRK